MAVVSAVYLLHQAPPQSSPRSIILMSKVNKNALPFANAATIGKFSQSLTRSTLMQ